MRFPLHWNFNVRIRLFCLGIVEIFHRFQPNNHDETHAPFELTLMGEPQMVQNVEFYRYDEWDLIQEERHVRRTIQHEVFDVKWGRLSVNLNWL